MYSQEKPSNQRMRKYSDSFRILQESQIPSDSDSSFVTEEDTSGNPLPSEVIEIRRKNKKLQKDLTNGIVNLKNGQPQVKDSDSRFESLKPAEKKLECSDDAFESTSNKEKLGSILSQIAKLQEELDNAREVLKLTEIDIYNEESEQVGLKEALRVAEDNCKEIESAPTGCRCVIW